MVYTSIPPYHQSADPPDWRNQQHGNRGVGGGVAFQTQQPPGRREAAMEINRPTTVDRGRHAKLTQPDQQPLNCPRCDSVNTKFCYYNNYSLSQPRHFCKACRRYWTRGGALRNVPVGGGCRRRNKRTSKSTSKLTSLSTSTGNDYSKAGASSSGNRSCGGGSGGGAVTNNNTRNINVAVHPSQSQQPFMNSSTALHHLTDYGGSGASMGFNFNITHAGVPSIDLANNNYQIGGGTGIELELDQSSWRTQQFPQFPLFTGLDHQQHQLYHFDGTTPAGFTSTAHGQVHEKESEATASDKMEEEKPQQILNLPKQYLGMSGNGQYWSGNINGNVAGSSNTTTTNTTAGYPSAGWMDLTGFNSASTGHLL